MKNATLSDEDLAAASRRIYDDRSRPLVGPAKSCRFVVVAVETGDCEVADTAIEAIDRL